MAILNYIFWREINDESDAEHCIQSGLNAGKTTAIY